MSGDIQERSLVPKKYTNEISSFDLQGVKLYYICGKYIARDEECTAMNDTAFLIRLWAAAVLLALLIALSINDAIRAGWFWKLSYTAKAHFAQKLFPGTYHFFEVGSHLGFLLSAPLTLFLAWAFAESSPRWNSPLAFIVTLLASLLAVYGMREWAHADNSPELDKHVLSGFSENGNFSVSGLCLTFTMAFTYTIAVMYFITPGPANTVFPFVFAIALTIALMAGLLQPPLYVWGTIHSAAWKQSAVFTALVWGLCFAHKFGYVVPS